MNKKWRLDDFCNHFFNVITSWYSKFGGKIFLNVQLANGVKLYFKNKYFSILFGFCPLDPFELINLFLQLGESLHFPSKTHDYPNVLQMNFSLVNGIEFFEFYFLRNLK